MRARKLPRSLSGTLLALGIGCGGPLPEAGPAPSLPPSGAEPAAGERAARPAEVDLGAAFAAAAQASGVPAELLIAIARTETNFYFVPGTAGDAFEGQPAYGVMALRGERLRRGAELAGVTLQAAQSEPVANIRAAAALLRAEADALGLGTGLRSDLAAWAPAVARYSGLPGADSQADYVEGGVYRTLRTGLSDETQRLHGLKLAPRPELPEQLLPGAPRTGTDWPSVYYSGARWKPAPSSNFTSGRAYDVELLVIHTCAGGYSGCWGWLTTPYPTNPNKTSAHYVVKEDGAEILALVDEDDTAHHVGKPWKGLPTNGRSVGIEHGGFPYEGTNRWTEGQIAASAKLSCDIVKRNRIVRDREHIIGHYQPDPTNRANDPGREFPWADYMNRINTCVGGTPPAGIIVDSNQDNNGANARIVAGSASWKSSTNVAGYWGSGYFVAPTDSVADSVSFEFQLAAAGTREVFAWWTAATDRTTTAPFVIFDAAGTKLATVYKNQQVDGGKWVSLGRYSFTAGWNRVSVSRWTTAGSQVVADAIRVE
ncbi:MAG: N-acetylmuramoyl-L-alanine amidase [Polyangia bacterium]